MDDPLLSTLCSICHIHVPKYTCPRCSVNTCSLPCSRRHKLWSSCNGVRDPTVYVPKSQFATPSGLDHDYNFIHSIEHGKKRSEKEIIEDRRLVTPRELERARQDDDRPWRPWEAPGEACINRLLQAYRIRVFRAPKGMRRNVENTTSWTKGRKTIFWQVEWLREGSSGRLLMKIMGDKPLGRVYADAYQVERRLDMTDEEKRVAKKRKAMGIKERYVKKAKLAHQNEFDMTVVPRLQNGRTSAWDASPWDYLAGDSESEDEHTASIYRFYLHRPNTPSSMPKVLVPLDSSRSLLDQLRKRELMEFPTIYLLERDGLPEGCILEKEFLKRTGQAPINPDEDSSSSEEDSDTSTSGSDSSDDDMEEGEIR